MDDHETRAAAVAAVWDEAARLDVPTAYAIQQEREQQRRRGAPRLPVPAAPGVGIRIFRGPDGAITAVWLDERTGQEIPIPIAATSVRAAQTEVTGWMIHRGYRARDSWTTRTETARHFTTEG